MNLILEAPQKYLLVERYEGLIRVSQAIGRAHRDPEDPLRAMASELRRVV